MEENDKKMDKAIRRIKKQPVGRKAEDFVNYFLAPWFSGYWAFQKPKHKGAEIADSLLLRGDVAFIIQIKERKGIKSDIKWAKHKIAEDKERISKWVERLKTEKSIILRNKYREVIFPRHEIKYYYGLIILNHFSEPYNANEFLREGSQEQKVAIQVISLADLYHLLRYINTPWDFVVYFESRFKLSQKTSLEVHREENVFVLNLKHMYHEMTQEIGKEKADEWNEFMDITIKAINGDLQSVDPGLRRYAASFLIDASIGGQLNKAPRDRKGNFVINDKFNLLIKAVEVLSEMTRLRRAKWGEIFLEQAEKALKTGKDEYKTGKSPKRGVSYGFIATNKSEKFLEDYIGPIAVETLIKNNQFEGIFVAAPPENVFGLYQRFTGWFTKDRDSLLQSSEIEALQSTILYINLR